MMCRLASSKLADADSVILQKGKTPLVKLLNPIALKLEVYMIVTRLTRLTMGHDHGVTVAERPHQVVQMLWRNMLHDFLTVREVHRADKRGRRDVVHDGGMQRAGYVLLFGVDGDSATAIAEKPMRGMAPS